MQDIICENYRIDSLPEIPEVGRIQISGENINVLRTGTRSEYIKLILLTSGYKKFWVDNETYNLRGGDLLMIFPDQIFGGDKDIQNKSSISYIEMSVPNEFEKFCMLESNERKILLECLEKLRGKRIRTSSYTQKIFSKLTQRKVETSILNNAYIRMLLLELLFSIIDINEPKNITMTDDVCNVIDAIKSRRDEMLSVGEMAYIANLSESRFKQKFKTMTGIPPAEFLIREKIREATKLLKTGKSTATEIAMDLGFSSSQHFSNVFKKYTGNSPLEYRRKNRKITDLNILKSEI